MLLSMTASTGEIWICQLTNDHRPPVIAPADSCSSALVFHRHGRRHTGGMDLRLRAAVDASVCWYDELFAVHGIRHRTAQGMWAALAPPPPLHSAAKSVQPWATATRALTDVAAFEHCSIADSFGSLDPPGFDVLFEARWIFREPSARTSPALPAGWAPVRTATALAEWTARHDTTGVLLPPLLDRPGFTVFGRRVDGRLEAGAVVHACAGVVSLSNVWAADSHDWTELVHLVEAVYPERAIVGYERGDDLEQARAAGFFDVGPQVVWIR
jgi:hypothetical protein